VSACEACAGSGKFVATQNFATMAGISPRVVSALREAAPLPAIVACPSCQGSGKRTCHACGCTDNDCSGCVRRTGEPCHWVKANLCSACAS